MNIIEKLDHGTWSQYENYTSWIAFSALLMLVLGFVLLVTYNISKKNVAFIIIIGALIFNFGRLIYYDVKASDYKPQPIDLTTLKDSIIVDGNHLTIKQLPPEYRYIDEGLRYDGDHNFKIEVDEIYTERPVQLIDTNGGRHEMTREQYEILKRGGK